MHEQRNHRAWLAVLGLYWLLEAIYLLWPVDLLPDFVPVFGYADDLVSLLAGAGVTALSLWRARPALTDGSADSSPTRHLPYEPVSKRDLDSW